MGQLSNNYNGLFHDERATSLEKLDKFAEPLRSSARDIVEFIEALSDQTRELKNLRDSYHNLQIMPANKLCSGIENIKMSLLKVDFISNSVHANTKEQQAFLDFFELQNTFNMKVNAFVKKVIQLEMLN